MPIERATGLHDGINRVAGMVGPPLAGVLMFVWSAPAVPLIDAASFLVAGVLIALSSTECERVPKHLQARVLGAFGALGG